MMNRNRRGMFPMAWDCSSDPDLGLEHCKAAPWASPCGFYAPSVVWVILSDKNTARAVVWQEWSKMPLYKTQDLR